MSDQGSPEFASPDALRRRKPRARWVAPLTFGSGLNDMNYTAAAIRKLLTEAATGAAGGRPMTSKMVWAGNALPMRALTEHLHDPAFWKALGKARNWQDTGAWLFHWHRFIDHIAFGKDVESFFSSL